MTKQAILAIMIAVVPAIAFATHVPSSTEKIEYDGTMAPGVAVTGVIGWTTPIDGYDWYCFDVTKGTKLTITVTRISGDLKLNLGIMKGVVDPGKTAGDLPILTNTGNSTDPGTTLTFTPDLDGAVTLWVSTFLGEKQGNYSVIMTGGAARSVCGTVVAPTGPQIAVTVPEVVFVNNNETVVVPVSVTTLSTFANDVTLSVSGLPDDVVVNFDKTFFPKPASGSANLTITTTALTFPGTYLVSVIATGGDQTGGQTFQLIVDCSPPVILGIDQPKSVTVNRGSTTRFEVTPNGTGPFFYQWYSGFSGQSSFPVASGKDRTLTTPSVNDTTSFWVRVSNACGSVDSQTATVSVR